MKAVFTSVLVFLILVQVSSQSEYAIKQEFEGKRVEVKIEMPASSEGIDIYADKPNKMDFEKYSKRIKTYGIGLYPGDVVMITKIKKKGKHIEFQLAGGGYGTSDDDSGSVSAAYISKSPRQEEIENMLDEDKDKKLSNRSKLQKELKELERERKLAQQEAKRQASLESEIKKSRIQEQRLQGGSRFNIRYDYKIGNEELTKSSIIEALKDYVNFSPGQNTSTLTAGDADAGSTGISKGMNMQEAMAIMGMPKSLNTLNDCGLEITTCLFEDHNQKLNATFVEKILVKYTMSSK